MKHDWKLLNPTNNDQIWSEEMSTENDQIPQKKIKNTRIWLTDTKKKQQKT